MSSWATEMVPWYRNAGKGDNLGTRFNLNKAKPRYHRTADDWIRSGRAICGANISRPGYSKDKPSQNECCRRCWKLSQEAGR